MAGITVRDCLPLILSLLVVAAAVLFVNSRTISIPDSAAKCVTNSPNSDQAPATVFCPGF